MGFQKKTFIVLCIAVATAMSSFAQKGVEDGSKYGHGKDSVRCIRNLSLYREYAKQKIYISALPYWRVVYNECPRASLNIYIDGVNIYKTLLKNAKTKEEKKSYLDTLQMVYDQRIKYFNKKANVLARKGIALMQYGSSFPEIVEDAYNAFKQCIDISENSTPPPVLAGYITASQLLLKEKKITNEDMVNNYASTIQIIFAQEKKAPSNKQVKQIKEHINKIFARTKASSCDALISIYQPKFDASPKDTSLLKSLTDILSTNNCEQTDLYYKALANFNEYYPSSESASKLAHLAEKNGHYKEAAEYYKKAIELEQDDIKKASLYINLGQITYSELNNYSQAEGYAEKAARLNPDNGKPYILLGNIYASATNCGENDFQKKAVYLLAVDMYKKAKSVDSTTAETANKYIKMYSKYYPDKETAFFHGYEEGSSYTVGGWINKQTTIRFKD